MGAAKSLHTHPQGAQPNVSRLMSAAEVERMLRRLLPDVAPLAFQHAMRALRTLILSRLERHAGWDALLYLDVVV